MALLCACLSSACACVSVCIMHARVCAHDAISCKVINIIVITALFRPKEHLKNENIPTFNIFPVFFVCDQFFYYICTQTVSYLRKESKGNSVKVRNSTRCCEFHLRIAPHCGVGLRGVYDAQSHWLCEVWLPLEWLTLGNWEGASYGTSQKTCRRSVWIAPASNG